MIRLLPVKKPKPTMSISSVIRATSNGCSSCSK